MEPTFFDTLTNFSCTEITSIITAISTFLLMLVAFFQLKKFNDNEKKIFSLSYIKDFEKDPEFRKSLLYISEKVKTKSGKDNFDELNFNVDKLHIYSILNYFDAIATGINQGIIIEELAYDSLNYPLKKAVETLILGKQSHEWKVTKKICPEEGYEKVVNLYHKWEKEKNNTKFFDKWVTFKKT